MGRRGWEGSGGRSWEGGREGEVRRRMEEEGREGVREKKKYRIMVILSRKISTRFWFTLGSNNLPIFH